MKTITFLNNKGGVGKSATVKTVAHMMATVHKKKVLVVDIDPQGNTTSLFTDVDWDTLFIEVLHRKTVESANSIREVLLDQNMDPHECIIKTRYKGLHIIPAFLTLSQVDDRIKADVVEPPQFRLKNQLDKLKDEYDYCLIDCSPSVSILNTNALAASDAVYIPTKVDGDSILGVAITINLVKSVQRYNPSLKVEGCFFTQFRGNKAVSQYAMDLLGTVLPPGTLLPVTIGVTKFIEEGTYEQMPLLEVDTGKKKSKATQDYLDLTEYILAKDKDAWIRKYMKKNPR